MEPRLTKRKELMSQQIRESESVVINQFGMDRKGKRGAERFLHNPNVEFEALQRDLTEPVRNYQPQGSGHVAVFEDTSIYTFELPLRNGQISRFSADDPHISDLSKKGGKGINAHLGLAVDLETEFPIGVAGLYCYANKPGANDKNDRDYKNLATSYKASQRWIDVPLEAIQNLDAASRITIVGDREADMYPLLTYPFGERVDLLVRLAQDRRVQGEEGIERVLPFLEHQPWSPHQFNVQIRAPQGGYKKVDLPFEVRYTRVELLRPKNMPAGERDQYPPSHTVTVIEVRQAGEVLQESDRIHWYLYTTAEINSIEDAIQMVQLYIMRWWIEDFFRLTKTEGFRMEESGLEDGAALKRLMMLMFAEAIKVLILRQGRLREDLPADQHFTPQECQLLTALHPRYAKKKEGHLCPYKVNSLSWAVWLIAHLGGWSGTKFDKRPPGVISLLRGYRRFNDLLLGFNLFANSSP